MHFENYVVVVTGAAGGIGQEIVREFSKKGATVFATDMKLEERSEQNVLGNGKIHYRVMDVTDSASVDRVFSEVEELYQKLDTLVNAAGIIGSGKSPYDTDEEEFDLLFRVNVKGTWLVTKRAVKTMKGSPQSNQSIVHFSSIAGLVAVSEAQAIYSATKGAIRLMAKNDAVFLAPHGIRVNSIHPGSIETEMALKTDQNSPLGAEYRRQIIAKHPLGRRGLPEEVARGVVFLASGDASFMTGSEFVVDGGFTAQ